MRCCCCCDGSGGNVIADGRHTLCLDAQRVLRDIKGILVGNGEVWCNKRVDDESFMVQRLRVMSAIMSAVRRW